MHCAKASRLIQLYIDKQLKLDQMRALETHLSFCQACRQEFSLFAELACVLQEVDLIAEPADLMMNVMRRVALSEQQAERMRREREVPLVGFRPSWQEWCAAVLLATIAMLGVILVQPSLRATLPIANGYDAFSLFFRHLWSDLVSINSGTLLFACWVVGTLLGVWITLTLVGAEMRSIWLRAVMNRLPVW